MTLIAFHSAGYAADIGEHVMPMRKFALVRAAIEEAKLDYSIREPKAATEKDLLRVHTREYVRAIASGEPRALAESQKFPWSKELADATRLTNGGCIAALTAALEGGVGANIASGFHHAHADHGEGFCTFNGLVVALEHARAHHKIERALVIDLDLHYGNGTASLLASRPDFHNLSIYGNWYEENKASRDVDTRSAPDTANCRSIPVANGTDGDRYLAIVGTALEPAIDRARPDVIVYQAGADPYREDPYSPLNLDENDLYRRDRIVFETCKRHDIPVCWVLAGGYTKDIDKVVAVHLGTARAAAEIFTA
jgi:acetoin utilization deacetylase AcuC-like enzyme